MTSMWSRSSIIIALFALCCLCSITMGQKPTSVPLAKWVQPLVKPPVLSPYCTRRGVDKYVVTMSAIQHRLHPDLNLTQVYGYAGTYPGGTIEAVVDRPVAVTWRNHLPDTHFLPTEPLGHLGSEPVPDSAAVPHLHGAHVPPDSDGDPMVWITRGQDADFYYPNGQLATTMWYHDHIMGRTRVNVYAGLVGFYLLRDEDEAELGLPSGEFEMPILIQDRIIMNNSQLYYPYTWGGFDGDTPVVNGKVYPYFEVKPQAYRFRFLNGCNSRYVSFSLPHGPTMWQIGTDGGFLNKAIEVQNLTLGSSERADVIIDFRGYEGRSLILTNLAGQPYPSGAVSETMKEVLQFRVARHGASGEAYKIPKLKHVAQLPRLPSVDTLPAGSIAQVRQVTLTGQIVKEGNKTSFMMLLNGKRYHEEPTETPEVDTVELWEIINLTGVTHPVHIHLTQFRVLQRRPFAGTTFTPGVPLNYTGPARLPDPNEQGWKDTVRVYPYEVVTLWVPFTEYTGKYVWHCHMLEHEDQDMMRPLVVLPKKPCACAAPSATPVPTPAHEHLLKREL